MKNYKNKKQYIGSSDMASLVLRSWDRIEVLNFGEVGDYSAYIADEETEIPSHYSLSHTFTKWLKIYDDETKSSEFIGREIKVYEAGRFGVILQATK